MGNAEIIREIEEHVDLYWAEGNSAYIKYAFFNYEKLMYPLEPSEVRLLNRIFSEHSYRALEMLQERIFKFGESITEGHEDIDFFICFEVLPLKFVLGEEEFKELLMQIVNDDRCYLNNKVFMHWMKVLKNMFWLRTIDWVSLLRIINTYDSWLAYRIRALAYTEASNEENAQRSFEKSDKLLRKRIDELVAATDNAEQKARIQAYAERTYGENWALQTHRFFIRSRKEEVDTILDAKLTNPKLQEYFWANVFKGVFAVKDDEFDQTIDHLQLVVGSDMLEYFPDIKVDVYDSLKFAFFRLRVPIEKQRAMLESQGHRMELINEYIRHKPEDYDMYEDTDEFGYEYRIGYKLLSFSGSEFVRMFVGDYENAMAAQLLDRFMASVNDGEKLFGRELEVLSHETFYGRKVMAGEQSIPLILYSPKLRETLGVFVHIDGELFSYIRTVVERFNNLCEWEPGLDPVRSTCVICTFLSEIPPMEPLLNIADVGIEIYKLNIDMVALLEHRSAPLKKVEEQP